LPGEGAALSEEEALRRGRQLHRLLENLPNWPRGDWSVIGADLLASSEDGESDAGARTALMAEAEAVLNAPDLAPIFAPGTLTEVEITADLLGRRLLGTIDRLVIDDTRVLAVDYKSNAIVPKAPAEVPEGLLRQMAAYRAALARVFPGHRIETALLWTTTPLLMPLPGALLDAALDRAGAALPQAQETAAPP